MKTKKSLKAGIAFILAVCMALACAACEEKRPGLAHVALEEEIELTAGESLLLAPQYGFDQELDPAALQDNVRRLEVSFTSSNEQVATVSPLGQVTALAQGEAVITLSAGGLSASARVTVAPRLTGISTAASIQLAKGESHTLTLAAQPAAAALGSVSFATSNAAVVTVNSGGQLTAVGCGEAAITVKSGAITKRIAVTVLHRVESIALDSAEGILSAGQSHQLTVAVSPADADVTLVWASSNEAVATVKDGSIEAISAGEATITVWVEGQNELFAEYRLTVTAAGGRAGAGGSSQPTTAPGQIVGAPGTATPATGGTQPAYTPGGAGDPNYFYCEICNAYHQKGVLAACGRGHSTIGTDCTWVLRNVIEATCWENRVEIYDCASNCGMCYIKTVENSTIPCEYTRLIDVFENDAIVQKYCCRMCGAVAP